MMQLSILSTQRWRASINAFGKGTASLMNSFIFYGQVPERAGETEQAQRLAKDRDFTIEK